MEEIFGRYQGTRRGFGFVIPDEGEDFFIPPEDQGGAWDGDRVTVRPTGEDAGAGRHIGKVTGVVARGNKTVTGRLCKEGRLLYLAPDSEKLPSSIVLTGKTHGAHVGDKVALAILSYGTRKTPPMGSLKECFGPSGTRKAATAAILYQHDIEEDFPIAVLDAAAAVPQSVPQSALFGRTDLREALIVTIDGLSAKDLDDAVSLTVDDKGRRVLGVHIADVSYYVSHNGVLDQEAYLRGTSVYFADRVIPMLPPALSNGICSLNQGVDRLALSCFMTLDQAGDVVDHKICRSVIRSAARLDYENCNLLLAGQPPVRALTPDVAALVRGLASLAEQRTKKRRSRGALLLESAECYFVCDGEGTPVSVAQRQSGKAEGLTEECMLLANETVAEHLCKGKLPGVFRVHENPSLEKIENLRTMLAPLGYTLLNADGHGLQALIDSSAGKPEAPAVNMMVLRSLMKAKYDGVNGGHFGLAAEYYCHFTSPIRRYPDLVVHRILTAALEHGTVGDKLGAFTQRAALQSSQREVAAQVAERDIEKLYMAEFMVAHVGETFAGSISGVTKFNIYVMLENGIEGALPLRRGEDETAYVFGAKLEVLCQSADPGTGLISFALPGEPPRAMRETPSLKKGPPKAAKSRKPSYRKSGKPPKASTRGKQRR